MEDKEIIKEFIHYIGDDDFYNNLSEADKIKYELKISDTIMFSSFKLRKEFNNLREEILNKITRRLKCKKVLFLKKKNKG